MPTIEQIPVIRRFRRELDTDIDELGLQAGLRKTLARYSVCPNVTPQGKDTLATLQTKSVVIASNHPFYIEPLILGAALPPREDAYLIGNTFFTGISNNLDRFLIPLYVRHRYFSKGPGLLGRLMDTFHPYAQMAPFEEYRRNWESLQTASQKVSDGGLVVIFPEAGSSRQNPYWAKGIETLMRNIDTKADPQLVFAFIKGTSDLDPLRVFKVFRDVLPKIEITLSAPKSIKEILAATPPRQLTAVLEANFHRWSSDL